jgi:hypothetical protein
MENYRLVLLDLFVLELSAKRLGVIFDSVVPELNKALAENDLKYLENFRGALDKKKKETPDFKSLFPEVDKKIFDFVEKAIFNEGCTLDLGFLIDILDSSSLEAQFCLDKIFKEGKVNLCILKLFFKFFPDRLSLFYENMDKKISDVRFIEEIMSSLDAIDLNLTAAILKHIFLSANNFIKIKVLEKMEKLHLNDEGFLFSILDKEDFLQCKRALLLLTRSPSARAKAAKILLSIPNPFGLKSRVIERNLELVSEVPFPEARPYLTALSRYKFFWNKNIRIKAQEVLKRHGV